MHVEVPHLPDEFKQDSSGNFKSPAHAVYAYHHYFWNSFEFFQANIDAIALIADIGFPRPDLNAPWKRVGYFTNLLIDAADEWGMSQESGHLREFSNWWNVAFLGSGNNTAKAAVRFFNAFDNNRKATLYAAFDRLIHRIRTLWDEQGWKEPPVVQRQAAETTNRLPPGSATPQPDEKPATSSKSRKIPSDKAIAAYRAYKFGGKNQTEVAAMMKIMHGETPAQGTVAKWCSQVEDFLKAGGVLPAMEKSSSHAIPVDPSVIELGERTDHRTKRQRK